MKSRKYFPYTMNEHFMHPNKWQFICLLFPILIAACSANLTNSAFWMRTDSWLPCSNECGDGIEYRQYYCVKSDHYNSIIKLNESDCIKHLHPVKENNTEDQRSCKLGPCGRGYRWRVSAWGFCSQTCGGLGIKSRDVKCVYIGDNGNDIVLSSRDGPYYCGNYRQPEIHTSCNRFACRPEFVPDQWGKCIQADPCRPGRQVRQLNCISVQVNGTQKELPTAACYMAKGRPHHATWRRCFEENARKCDSKPPMINTDTLTIVQMRKVKVIDLKVGQRAYVIPYTRVTVRCPVHYFTAQQLQWFHLAHGRLSYTGPVANRVRVDKRGRLHIRSFRLSDEGEWMCMAGPINATVTLTARTPAAGYHDWVQRHRFWSKGMMMMDDAKSASMVHEIVQWVEGPWSACSTSCGEVGKQFRVVRCEKVDSRYYHILNDQVCIDKLLPKPLASRKCLESNKCPTWRMQNSNKSMCTDNCVDVGKGRIWGNLTCYIGDNVVSEKYCDSIKKPDMNCQNPKCQVQWNISEWSQCSRSCGGVGVQARQLMCVWVNNAQSAGSLCYKHKIPIPKVVQTCETPPCVLGCVDFSQNCPNKLDLCKFALYRYHCCKSCKNYSESMKNRKIVI